MFLLNSTCSGIWGDQGGQDQGQAGQGGRAGEKRGILVSSFDSYAFEKITLNDITAKQAGRPFKWHQINVFRNGLHSSK